jgi:hypothetical protein
VSPAIPPESVARPRRLQAAFRGPSSRADPSNPPGTAHDAAPRTVTATVGQNRTRPAPVLGVCAPPQLFRVRRCKRRFARQSSGNGRWRAKRSIARTAGRLRGELAGPSARFCRSRLPNACGSISLGHPRGGAAVHSVARAAPPNARETPDPPSADPTSTKVKAPAGPRSRFERVPDPHAERSGLALGGGVPAKIARAEGKSTGSTGLIGQLSPDHAKFSRAGQSVRADTQPAD